MTDFITSASITVNSSTEEIVNKILKPLGLPHNFVLVPYPNIDNALAITTKDGTRYIVYDENFMQSINRETGNWASWSILAHEIGHHLCGHTLVSVNSLPDQRQKEFQRITN